jgi:hypothetical protein
MLNEFTEKKLRPALGGLAEASLSAATALNGMNTLI